MRHPGFVCLLVFNFLAAIAAELPAETPTPESIKRRQFNQVFVKVIVPVTSRSPKQDGPVVESWVGEKLEQLGESDSFAVTDWVPVCDGLLADDVVDNRVWDGGRVGKSLYCPVGGDIPERETGRLLVKVGGWLPGGGCEANITLSDEPGNRAVGHVQMFVGGKPVKYEDPLPYVAVIIMPPPLVAAASLSDAE